MMAVLSSKLPADREVHTGMSARLVAALGDPERGRGKRTKSADDIECPPLREAGARGTLGRRGRQSAVDDPAIIGQTPAPRYNKCIADRLREPDLRLPEIARMRLMVPWSPAVED
jgi:hypothetical protein